MYKKVVAASVECSENTNPSGTDFRPVGWPVRPGF